MEPYNMNHSMDELNPSAELLACRACLATDSKLFNLYENRLAELLGELTGTLISQTDGLPQHICIICYVLLNKSAEFRARCQKVHVLLQDARLRKPVMTISDIKSFDRAELKPHLSFSNAFKVDFLPKSGDDDEEQNPLEKTETVIGTDPVPTNLKKSNNNFIEIAEPFNTTESNYNVKPNHIPESNYIPEPKHIPDSNFIPEQIYIPERVYIPEQIYIPEPIRVAEPIFMPKPIYMPEPIYIPNYVPESNLNTETKHNPELNINLNLNPGPQPNHSTEPNHTMKSNRSPDRNHNPEPNYTLKQSYSPEPNRSPKPNHSSESNYSPEPDYSSESNCSSESNYKPESDYKPKTNQRPEPKRSKQKRTTQQVKEDNKKSIIKQSERKNNVDTSIEIYTKEFRKQIMVLRSKGNVEEKTATKEKSKKKKEIVKKIKEKPVKDKEKKQKKLKRPCNIKFEEDFAGFAAAYNCEVVYLTKEQQLKEVEERKELPSYIKSRFKCTICYKGFMNVSAHKNHMSTHEKTAGDHLCEVCQSRFPTRVCLLRHLRRHKYSFTCKICDHVSKGSTVAKLHFKRHEGVKYECKTCDKQFNSRSTYLSHQRQYHNAVICDMCKETVLGSKGLEEHNQRAHVVVKFPCTPCRKQFESQEAFNRHLSTTGVCLKHCPCTKCGENFQTKHMLYDHREAVHKETLYRCEECPSAFNTGRRLAAHWKLRHSNASFMCEVCARSYSSRLKLRDHQRIHTGEKPFPCPMCSKCFRIKTNLKLHTYTHTGERPYKCLQCDDAFKSYSQRHKHVLMVHKKERPHKCDMCEKTYVIPSDLKMHIRTFHMKIPLPRPNRRKNRNRNHNPPALVPIYSETAQ